MPHVVVHFTGGGPSDGESRSVPACSECGGFHDSLVVGVREREGVLWGHVYTADAPDRLAYCGELPIQPDPRRSIHDPND